MIHEGWGKWNQAIKWWHDNSKWAIDWLKSAAAGFGALMIVSTITELIKGLTKAMILLDHNPFTALGLAATFGAYEAIKHWSQVKRGCKASPSGWSAVKFTILAREGVL